MSPATKTANDRPVRIYDLARELNVPSAALIERLQKQGLTVRVPSNSVPADAAERVRREIRAESARPSSPTVPAARREPEKTETAPEKEPPSALGRTVAATTARRAAQAAAPSPPPATRPVDRTPRPPAKKPIAPSRLAGRPVPAAPQPGTRRREAAAPPPKPTERRQPAYPARRRGEGSPATQSSPPQPGERRIAYSSRGEKHDTTRAYHPEQDRIRPPKVSRQPAQRTGRFERPTTGGVGGRPTPGRAPFGRPEPGAGPGPAGVVRPQPRRLQQRSRDRTRELLREREQARERDLSQRGRVTDRDEELVLPARDEIAEIMEGSTVAEVAKALGIRTNLFMAQLFKMSILATINQTLDAETLALLEEPFQFVVTKRPTLEEQLVQKATEIQDDPASLVPRAPVVTIMGHVDHGKTSLLDAVRESNIAEHEAGSITQHIGAYDVRLPNGRVVFLDTPGHEAFTAMRARGARVTDVVVLVVAADDGVMPQTVEAINHARAAEVPIVVAVNKIDVPNANIERVRNQLARLELVPEEWGGKTIFAEISAKQRTGIAELLEYLALETDLLELKANPDRPAVATVIEAKLDKGRGPVATVLVQNGTLRVGDYFCAGVHHGRARALIGDRGQRIEEAGPSTPVEVLGIGGVPMAGDSFLVLEERDAISLAANRQRMAREQRMVTRPRVSLDELHRRIQEGSVKELNIILKADVEGSIEPILSALSRLHTSEVQVRVIHQGVGGISETDVMLAAASSAVIIGFNVRPTARAARLAAHEDVDVRTYDVIYTVVSDIRAALEGMLEPEMQEQVLGRATVRELFRVPRMGVIAGSYVNNGRIVRGSNVRVLRDNRVVHEGKVDSLRRFKDDVSEVAAGYECGIGVESFHDFKLDDVLECFTFERVARTLSLDESDDRSS